MTFSPSCTTSAPPTFRQLPLVPRSSRFLHVHQNTRLKKRESLLLLLHFIVFAEMLIIHDIIKIACILPSFLFAQRPSSPLSGNKYIVCQGWYMNPQMVLFELLSRDLTTFTE